MADRDELYEALDWVLDNWVDVHHRMAAGEAVDLGGGRRIAIIEPIPDVGTSVDERIWLHIDDDTFNTCWVDAQDAFPDQQPVFRIVTPTDIGDA